MTPQGPSFEELVGGDLDNAERERLRAVHELLVQADAPPELSPELEAVPWPDEALAPLGLRRRTAQPGRPWLRYATLAAAVFVFGFLLGQTKARTDQIRVVKTVAMHGTSLAPGASATIAVGTKGGDGNWPMVVRVSNLPPLTGSGYYDLWLSRHGHPVALCGSFNTQAQASTIVRLSAAYSLVGIDGWIVTRHVEGRAESRAPLLTT